MTDERFKTLALIEEGWYKIGCRKTGRYWENAPPEIEEFWDEFTKRYGEGTILAAMYPERDTYKTLVKYGLIKP